MLSKPTIGEYPAYMQKYLDQLPEGDILDQLDNQIDQLQSLLETLTEEQAETPYAPGKWSIKELVNHLIDTERILAYRALCIARGESQPLPGFDEDSYARDSFANQRPLKELLDEHELVRLSTIALYRSFNPLVFQNTGNANGNPASVRALAFVIAAHEQHHYNILISRYLVKAEVTL